MGLENKQNQILSIFIAIIFVGSFGGTANQMAFATHVTPLEKQGNSACPSGSVEIFLEGSGLVDGTYTSGAFSLTLDFSSDLKFVDWIATHDLREANIKGGNNHYEYSYPGDQDFSDDDLRAPNNPGGQQPAISNVRFCFDPNAPPADPCFGVVCTPDANVCTDEVCQDGVCVSVPVSAGTSCGDSSDTICDNPDTCDDSGTCQPNFEPAITECRASAGICDVAEFCDGTGSCPADGFVAAGTECAASTGVCDLAEQCTGDSANCPADGPNLTTECRASAGICDVAEFCSDASDDCPADGFVAAETECRASTNECDPAEACTGDSAVCPEDEFAPVGTLCSAGVCNADPACVVNAVKIYTHTNVEVGEILDDNGTPDDTSDDFLRPRTVAEANFGTPLDQDIDDNYVLRAVLNKQGKILNYNPGQYYAVTKVTLGSEPADVSILEDFSDCTSTPPANISVVNPPKVPGGALAVVVTGGIVYDVSGALAATGGLTLAGDLNSASAFLEDVPANSEVYLYVKFGPGLKNTNYAPTPKCHNTETVTVTVEDSDTQGVAEADLILLPK
jgi:hypothetical protein